MYSVSRCFIIVVCVISGIEREIVSNFKLIFCQREIRRQIIARRDFFTHMFATLAINFRDSIMI